MFEAKNGRIKITKGDSGSLRVCLETANGNTYEMKDGDTLTLTVKRKPGAEKLLEIVSTNNILKFNPSDTKNLDIGVYCFDIELKTSDDVFTVVGPDEDLLTNMTVLPEITE